jgi:hypothetical protein
MDKMPNHAQRAVTPRPFSEYHEDMGNVLWWKFPIEEPPYCGSPLDLGHPICVTVNGTDSFYNIGGWPGYHTHFTPLPDVEAINTAGLALLEAEAKEKAAGDAAIVAEYRRRRETSNPGAALFETACHFGLSLEDVTRILLDAGVEGDSL